jgi:hypothetical protein
MEFAHSIALGAFASSIIPGGGIGAGMTHQLLHGGEIHASIEQIAGKGAAQIMRGKGCQAGLLTTM